MGLTRMPYPDKIELARAKMAQAEYALEEYLGHPVCHHEQVLELEAAVHVARAEFINLLKELLPRSE